MFLKFVDDLAAASRFKFVDDLAAAARFAYSLPAGHFSPAQVQERLLNAGSVDEAISRFSEAPVTVLPAA